MKTIAKYILFACILASVSPVLGQSYSAIAEEAGYYDSVRTIVRTFENYAVSYVRESGRGYLYVTQVDNMATEGSPYAIHPDGKKYPLPGADFEINDIQILQNVAFFCGHNSSTALYGWITIPYTPGAEFHYYFLPGITDIKQLVVYKDTASEKLVAIGENAPGSPCIFRKDVIVEINNPTTTSYSSNYTLYTMPYTDFDKKEGLYDIVLTEDSIAFIGYDTENGISLCTRWADKSNISGTIQNRYDYSLPDDEIYGNLLATVIDSSKWVAITYVHNEIVEGFSTRIRLIEIPETHNMVHSQEYFIEDKNDPYEISYNPFHEVLTVLQNCMAPMREAKFRHLDPFPIVQYPFIYLTYPNVEFTSMCQFDNNHYFSTGTNQLKTSKFWYMQDLNSPFLETSRCPYLFQDRSFLLSSPYVAYHPQSLTSTINMFYYFHSTMVLDPVVPSLICNEPYYKKD